MLFCTKCGSDLSEDSLFCNKCGTEINAIQKVVQSSQVNDETQVITLTPEEQRAQNIKQIKSDAKPILGCFGLIIVFFILLGACGAFNKSEPKRLEDYTNKEMNDFLKWKLKEDQKQRDNEPFFK
ncbi:zinc-ribbon domain-containing protein [Paenibacillus sp. JNUCC31]|uniref:zinc-ribbon domain-containing protein n=1 Tax=Paenibacillus sp. JNUCC-31 TaxID=2777983 RepID=UPI0017824F84|nr:zinc-ribbon domain-containing protein [Paenibacillus sp. JNUCC-31]QOS80160.1 zinc-ribbon domain-containing protein [Paenibacillus sp. JNUCC-31]